MFGQFTNRWGGRRLTIVGLILAGCMLPVLGQIRSLESAFVLYVLQAASVAMVIIPSLAYIAETTSRVGVGSFGIAYGLYNVGWGIGLVAGPAFGGFLFERVDLTGLAAMWALFVIIVALLLASAGADRTARKRISG